MQDLVEVMVGAIPVGQTWLSKVPGDAMLLRDLETLLSRVLQSKKFSKFHFMLLSDF